MIHKRFQGINLPKITKKHTLPLILISLFTIITLTMGAVSAAEWTVGPGGSYNYNSIQDAINNQSTLAGDTITVAPNGTDPYTENVIVNKNNLTIQANGAVTVSGSSNPSNPVFTVNNQGAYANIIGFILTGATNSAGVLVTGTNNVTLTNLTINNCHYGVLMTGTSSNIIVDGATINGTTGQGILLPHASWLTNVTINNTQIINCQSNAIQREWTDGYLNGITIQNTIITNPKDVGIVLDGNVKPLTNVIIDNVTINQAKNNGIIILMNNGGSHDLTITQTTSNNNGDCGVYLENLRGTIKLENNTFQNNNGWGI
ncbi:MAG: right-handed parallel beta-helix repeat-containing protein, partial [Methanobacteriaceae archaeon]|nr:right-handed parallel beta-helix repeat-containing protein [Methanobacteriaceae archaeon]